MMRRKTDFWVKNDFPNNNESVTFEKMTPGNRKHLLMPLLLTTLLKFSNNHNVIKRSDEDSISGNKLT